MKKNNLGKVLCKKNILIQNNKIKFWKKIIKQQMYKKWKNIFMKYVTFSNMNKNKWKNSSRKNIIKKYAQ